MLAWREGGLQLPQRDKTHTVLSQRHLDHPLQARASQPRQALIMRPPVPATTLTKAQISGPEPVDQTLISKTVICVQACTFKPLLSSNPAHYEVEMRLCETVFVQGFN